MYLIVCITDLLAIISTLIPILFCHFMLVSPYCFQVKHQRAAKLKPVQLKMHCFGVNWLHQQMNLGFLPTILVFEVLVFLRESVAICSRGIFGSTCICVNDIYCASPELSSDEQLCNCDNGTELSMGTAKTDRQKMSQNRTVITSLYISGSRIQSLEPF